MKTKTNRVVDFFGEAKGMKEKAYTTVSLGKPIKSPCLIPVLHTSTPNCINSPFMVDGKAYGVTALSFGTPHGAVIVDDVDKVDVATLGEALGTHVLFPKGASIVFIQVVDGETIKVRLWQQGAGETAFTPEAAGVAAAVSRMLQKTSAYKTTVLMGNSTVYAEWNIISDVKLTYPVSLTQIREIYHAS